MPSACILAATSGRLAACWQKAMTDAMGSSSTSTRLRRATMLSRCMLVSTCTAAGQASVIIAIIVCPYHQRPSHAEPVQCICGGGQHVCRSCRPPARQTLSLAHTPPGQPAPHPERHPAEPASFRLGLHSDACLS